MNLLESWIIHTPAAAALGKTLLHSLWEGTAVALLLAVALCFLRSSRIRYAVACLAMLSLVGIFSFTFTRVMPQQRIDGTAAAGAAIPPAPEGTNAQSMLDRLGVRRSASDYIPWLAPFWTAGVVLFHLRSVTTWMAARRMRRTGVCLAPDLWQSRLNRLSARLRISTPVRLIESCLSEVPVVIGYLRPVILMPVGLLTGLPAAQVEAILLHELAHIRRHDYLANLLQVLVENLLFYHPAVWWVSSVVRTERENCCDDLVVMVKGGAYEYAHALAALEQRRRGHREALAATGGDLVKRIRRLLSQPQQPAAALTPIVTAAVLAAAVTTAMAWESVAPADVTRSPASQTSVKLLAQTQRPPEPVRKQSGARDAVQTTGGPEASNTAANTDALSPYRKWMNEDVAYIIQDQEKQSFRQLTTGQEREQFIEQFWQRRDPTPGTAMNEMKEEHYRRIAYANERFASSIPGWKTDRGRIYIVYGPPDEIEAHPSGGSYRRPAEQGGGTISTFPFEQWRYKWIEGLGRDVIIEFADPTLTGEFRMTMDPTEKDVRRFAQLNRPPVAAGRIFVIGEVNRPGGYELVVPTTVLQALVNADGFRSTANTKTIVIQRGTIRLNFNYDEVFRGVNPAQNLVLQPGDLIIVK